MVGYHEVRLTTSPTRSGSFPFWPVDKPEPINKVGRAASPGDRETASQSTGPAPQGNQGEGRGIPRSLAGA